MTKIVHLTTIDVGGAYNGAKRLNEMLIKNGIDSKVIVRTKTDANSLTVCAFDNPISELVSKAKNAVNLLCKRGEVKRDILGTDMSSNPIVKEADIIFIHWISTFLSPKEIYRISQLKDKKVFFVMHDMWLFTGGCHVDRRCGGYERECLKCPLAKKHAANQSFISKKKWITKSNITITGPSRWIVSEAEKSSICDGKVIKYLPNVYDEQIFYPRNSISALREKYGLSKSKRIIMFGAADLGINNSNKGFAFLLDALMKIDMNNIQLVVLGNAEGAKKLLKNYDVVCPGFISDEYVMADIYSAADVFVNPSLQESFGYTVCEAMACGTPVVAFAVGGMLDQIEHKVNGYLAEFCNSNDLATGINYSFDNIERLKHSASVAARKFSYSEMYNKVRELF